MTGRSLQKDNAGWPDYPFESTLPTCAGSMWLRPRRLRCSFPLPSQKTKLNAQEERRLKSALVARCSSHRCPSRRTRLLSLRATASRRQTDELTILSSAESQRRVRSSPDRVVVNPYCQDQNTSLFLPFLVSSSIIESYSSAQNPNRTHSSWYSHSSGTPSRSSSENTDCPKELTKAGPQR